jgi:hypothetical protein
MRRGRKKWVALGGSRIRATQSLAERLAWSDGFNVRHPVERQYVEAIGLNLERDWIPRPRDDVCIGADTAENVASCATAAYKAAASSRRGPLFNQEFGSP